MSSEKIINLSASPSSRTIVIRRGHLADWPALYRLARDYRDFYCPDDVTVSADMIRRDILDGRVLVLECRGYPVGVVSYSLPEPGLHCQVYLLVAPQALLACIRQRVFEQVIDRLFVTLDVRKLKAQCLQTQTSTRKLLRRLKFKQCGLFRNEVLKNGRPVDVLHFELHRAFWERMRSD